MKSMILEGTESQLIQDDMLSWQNEIIRKVDKIPTQVMGSNTNAVVFQDISIYTSVPRSE